MDRKLVKQTVMASVYGVTYIDACDQIKRRLKESCVPLKTMQNCLLLLIVLQKQITLIALGEMFEAARSMSWLWRCSNYSQEPFRGHTFRYGPPTDIFVHYQLLPVKLRGVANLTLWPSKTCPEPLDISNDLTFNLINRVLLGTLWSLKWTKCCFGWIREERVKHGRKEETKHKFQGSTVTYGGYRNLR